MKSDPHSGDVGYDAAKKIKGQTPYPGGYFQILPRRWIVERTFGWLMRHRRLVRDYEKKETSAEAWAYIAMIRIQLRRLA